MRLICPNCGAQYEVDETVIPDHGRDVQCSNCGHTWFQQPGHKDPELAAELGEDLADTGDAAAQEVAEVDLGAEEPRGLDPDVASVLREEAERESAARQAEAEGLETQPDLGLDEAAQAAATRSAAARARMARLRGFDDTPDPSEPGAPDRSGSRRDLLPDIEEINSSLRASKDRDEAEDEELLEIVADVADPKQRRRGFRLGFGLMMLLIAGGVILYGQAERVVELLPQSEAYMIAYVDWANVVRTQVNSGVDIAVAQVQSLISMVRG